MAVAGLYRRPLPSPPAIDFSSPQGKKLFTEAHHNGNMEGFFKLIPHFQTQSEPAYCGLATLAMVLNALAIDPCRKWKGPWRWFDETMLDCCEPLDKVKAKGISFGKVVCLAHCAGANVKAFRTNHSSIDEFRKYILACSASDDCHVVTSYDRRTFKQVPVCLVDEKLSGILFCRLEQVIFHLLVAITPRVIWFMLVSRQQRSPTLLYNLSCKTDSWITIAKYLTDDVPLLLRSKNFKGIKDVISTIVSSLPLEYVEFIKWVMEIRGTEEDDVGQLLSEEEKGRLAFKEEVLKLVRETCLYKHVFSSENYFCKKDHSSSMHASSSDVLTALLLALPSETWSAVKDEQVFKETCGLVSDKGLPSLLQDEVLHLRGQILVVKRCKDDNKVEDDLHALLV